MIREQIMALTYKEITSFGGASKAVIYDVGYCDAKQEAADLAEARERELLAKIELLEVDSRILIDTEEVKHLAILKIEQLEAERAQMIAELRGILIPDNFTYQTLIHKSYIEAIINKYEVKK
jgi:hypothetical protein